MKVGYFVETPVEKNLTGGSRSFLDLIARLIPMGIEPYVVVSEKWALTDRLDAMGVSYITAKMLRPFVGVDHRVKFFRIKYRIKLLINSIARMKAKLFLKKNNVQLIHINSQFCGLIGTDVARSLQIPYIYHIREDLENGFGVRFYNRKLADKRIENANTIIAISDAIKQMAAERFPRGNIVRIYNGINPENFSNNYPRRFTQDVVKLVITGRVCDNKNQLEAVKAVEVLKNSYPVKLFIVGYMGTDVYETMIAQYIEDHKLNEFVELVPFTSNPYDFIQSCDVGLMCSKNEAFGRVTIEYMMSGLLTVGARCSGTLELIQDRKTGLFYDLNSPDSLAECIQWSIEHPDEANEIINRGYSDAMNNFNIKLTAKKVYGEYQKILG